ncbi:hypothetical protein H2200_007973 [Cladophialophora chaetospira]|uniref:Uncharacterized protein n=1 Tax=Cladophialophora chaetospira TaxID=386627 RepID=A0AA38X6Y0_9EURO|nr:hypothetical protein H2200_007973 [Cladophialophora chaetospira]
MSWVVVSKWLALLACVAVGIRFYKPELFDRLAERLLARPQPQVAAAEPPPAKRQKAKRTLATRLESSNSGTATPTLSSTEGKANKKRKLISPPVENKVVARTSEGQQATLPRDENDEMSNKEFAQQLAKAQAGTKLEPAKAPGASKKERRAAAKAAQGKTNGVGASGPSTETSSTTGRDGDDDPSPAGSPSTGAVSTAPTSRAGDVSDMLEPPTAKAGVLRLTDVKEDRSKTASKSSQAFQPALSKKQRQRQAEAAEKKRVREESDRLHEQKKQAQLRTARMAEGSSNQSKANAFAAKQNVWQSNKPAAEHLTPTAGSNEATPLLDTFDKTETSTLAEHGAVTSEPLSKVTNSVPETANVNAVRKQVGGNTTSALAASEREKISRPRLESQSSWADEVNEEEQDKWANDLAQEEQWESVTSKKGKKKAKKENGDTSSEASASFARPATNSKPTVNGNQTNGVKKPRAENLNRFQSIEAMNGSSFKDAEWEA